MRHNTWPMQILRILSRDLKILISLPSIFREVKIGKILKRQYIQKEGDRICNADKWQKLENFLTSYFSFRRKVVLGIKQTFCKEGMRS